MMSKNVDRRREDTRAWKVQKHFKLNEDDYSS